MNNYTLVILIVVMVAFMWWTSSSRKKQMAKMEQEKRDQLAAVKPGEWVRTRVGFWGRFVDLDGDIIVVRQQETAENGEIVVAMIEDEATVKRIFYEPERVRLQPENSTMEPIYADSVSVLGKVMALFRQF